jgi:hypothetical protein
MDFKSLASRLIDLAKGALRKNLLPFVLIQACGIGIVIAYYNVPVFQSICTQVALFKVRWGILFVVGSGAFAGAIVPEIAKVLTGQLPKKMGRDYWSNVGFTMGLFAIASWMNDHFYHFQAVIFGSELTLSIIVKKTLVDQFVYGPLVIINVIMLLQLWRENGWNLGKALKCWDWEFMENRWLPLVVINWCYWIPMIVCLYCMPSDLQFMFFVAASAAWSLILIFILKSEKA